MLLKARTCAECEVIVLKWDFSSYINATLPTSTTKIF